VLGLERLRPATLLLSCPDAKGVVAGVAELVYRHGGNIVHADQHTDREQGVFLQRAISRPAFSSAR
jgi:formyltetrahydrofolate hydrolase